jgi:hypothetical protein
VARDQLILTDLEQKWDKVQIAHQVIVMMDMNVIGVEMTISDLGLQNNNQSV